MPSSPRWCFCNGEGRKFQDSVTTEIVPGCSFIPAHYKLKMAGTSLFPGIFPRLDGRCKSAPVLLPEVFMKTLEMGIHLLVAKGQPNLRQNFSYSSRVVDSLESQVFFT